MARVVISLDCDGTMWLGNPPGPVSIDLIKKWVSDGASVVLISDSGNCAGAAQFGIPRIPTPAPYRHLVVSAILFIDPSITVYYIDDSPGGESVCRNSIDPQRCVFIHTSRLSALPIK